MKQHLGEEFVGVISAVAEFGLFVTLKDLYVDGMIHVSQLGDDYFVYDQPSQSLIGQARGQTFSLGDEVKIKVAAVNLDDRKIDFELLQQITHAGRAIRSRAPRVAKTTTEEVFSPRAKAVVSEDGEQPIRKKKPKTKSAAPAKKSDKKSSAKSDAKAKDKLKKKSKPKKKKSNAKTKLD